MMKPDEQYKHSGIEWLGQVPGRWEVKKLKYVLQLSNEKTESQKSDLRYIGMENIVSNTGELTETILEAEGVANIFHQNEILFGKLRPYLAKVYLAQMDGICSTEFLVYKTSKQIFNKFAFYLMICPNFIETVNSSTYGTKMPRANSDFLANLNIAIPPLPEQTAIADFLDEKTARIQTAIGIKNEQIAKLKEYRQALINQTVTKGLKANVAMKNSGVAWLGDVPEHWEVKKIKYIGRVVNGSTPNSNMLNYWDGDIVWLTPKDIQGQKYIGKSERNISEKGYESCGTQLVPANSIVLTTRAPIGKVSISEKELCTNQGCKSIVLNKYVNHDYIYYFLLTIDKVLNSLGTGTTFMELATTNLNNLNIAIPPLPEQLAIAEFLDEKTAQIDTAISQYQRQIERLKEYRQSLVNEAVTGKIRIKQD